MRGARFCLRKVPALTGIIPADAGSTRHHIMRGLLRQDHPRGCGEHYTTITRKQADLGSSPRMRGARLAHIMVAVTPRIIPADAGSTNGSIF